MNKSARDLLDRVSTWPQKDVEELNEMAREIEARRTGVYDLTAEEEKAIREGLRRV